MEKITKVYEELEPNERIQCEFDSPLWHKIYSILLEHWDEDVDFDIELAMFLKVSNLDLVIVRSTEVDLAVFTKVFLFLPDLSFNLMVLKEKVSLSIEKFSVINQSFFTAPEFRELLELFRKYCQYTENWYGTVVQVSFGEWSRVDEIFKKYPEYKRLEDSENTELWTAFKTDNHGKCNVC